MSRRPLHVLALVAAFVPATPRAWAMPPTPAAQPADVDRSREQVVRGKAEELYLEGSALYTAADYLGAIRAFTDALKVVAQEGGLAPAVRSALIFNLAQSHVRAHGIDHDVTHLRVARDLYRRLLQEADDQGTDAEERTRIEGLLAETERMLERDATAPAQPQVVAPEPTTSPSTTPKPTPTPPVDPAAKRHKAQRAGGIALLAIGSALAVTGIGILGWGATFRKQAEDDIVNPDAPSANEQERLDDETRKGRTVMGVGGGVLLVGAAALAGGVVLWLRSQRPKPRTTGLRAFPILGREIAGLGLSARF